MRSILACLVLLLSAVPAPARQRKFEHIIVVIQENRTPDNLFSDCTIPGADLQHKGRRIPLGHTYDLDHSHAGYLQEAAGRWVPHSLAYVGARHVQPYCQLAAQYGFANRMFQTNQGPSFPAHQFLFAGTSAPNATSNLFVAENPDGLGGGGCLTSNTTAVIDPSGKESTWPSTCFDLPTLSDVLDTAGVSWRYYAVSDTKIWNAPAAISHICQAKQGKCMGTGWQNVILDPPQVLTDITNCNLPSVAWVTPAGAYSDHPSETNSGGGPKWVASIVNAVGTSCGYWQNTAILVTWDDWGGWYDHVAPLSNRTGWCTSYCYGFRVPLLVISAHTPTMVDHVTHDFGSILQFVEHNFGLPYIGPGIWADRYADDLSNFFSAGARRFVAVPVKKVDWSKIPSDPDDY